MELEHFTKTMLYLQKMFNHTIDSITLNMYWKLLGNMIVSEFEQVSNSILETFKPTAACPFPVPAHFISALEKIKEERSRYRGGMYEQYKQIKAPDEEMGTPEEREKCAAEIAKQVKELCKKVSMDPCRRGAEGAVARNY